jgi:class 3 adenylate cyclase/YHS domain-containing protein
MGDRTESHTFVFADLAGFTALTEAMGDVDAADLASQFYVELSGVARGYRAEVVKAIGDAAMVRAEDAGSAIGFALEAVHDIGGRHFFPAVRAGIHTGPAVERDGDWFGSTVNLAARISGEAGGGEVLLSDATRAAAGPLEGIELHERGQRELRNVAAPVVLYAAVREGARTSAGLPIDPVCRMAVDPDHAAGRLRYEGSDYHFCSLQCVGLFAGAPGRYLRGR